MIRSCRRDAGVLAAYCVLIFVLSHRPTLPMPMLFPHQDKLHHLVAYAVMGLLAWRAFSWRLRGYRELALVTVIFCSFYGVTDEYHQSFIAGRDSDVVDWLADTAGAAVATMMLWYRSRLKRASETGD